MRRYSCASLILYSLVVANLVETHAQVHERFSQRPPAWRSLKETTDWIEKTLHFESGFLDRSGETKEFTAISFKGCEAKLIVITSMANLTKPHTLRYENREEISFDIRDIIGTSLSVVPTTEEPLLLERPEMLTLTTTLGKVKTVTTTFDLRYAPYTRDTRQTLGNTVIIHRQTDNGTTDNKMVESLKKAFEKAAQFCGKK